RHSGWNRCAASCRATAPRLMLGREIARDLRGTGLAEPRRNNVALVPREGIFQMFTRSLACLAMLFAVGCTTTVSGNGNTGGGGTRDGGPGTSSGPTPPPSTLKPNPNNPVGCPATLPTLGTACPADTWLTCSYVGDTCMEWVVCEGGCVGTSV